ncbi:unnamed protein product [Urochloa humidicola]
MAMEEVMRLEAIITEIALCLPPEEPEHLFRAAQICKIWRNVIRDEAFHKAYVSRYPKPPLLGYFDGNCNARFVPLRRSSLCPPPVRGQMSWHILDCRHGRVLVHRTTGDRSAKEPYDLVVWDPVSGEQEPLPLPPRGYQYFAGAVLCDSPICNHVKCGSYMVVFVGTDEDEDDADMNIDWASTYSSMTGQWSKPVKLERALPHAYRSHPVVEMSPPLFIRGALYFSIDGQDEEGFLKYHLGDGKLSVINQIPIDEYVAGAGVMIASPEGLFSVVTIAEDGELSIWSWRENISEPPEWILSGQINRASIQKITHTEADSLSLRGSVDGSPTIFVDNGSSLFSLDIATLEEKKLGELPTCASIIPFMAYVVPAGEKVGALCSSDKKANVEPSGQKAGDEKGVPTPYPTKQASNSPADKSGKSPRCDKNSMENPPTSDFGLSHSMTSTFMSLSGLHSIKDESSSAAELESDKIVVENREIGALVKAGKKEKQHADEETYSGETGDSETPKPEVIGKKREIEAVTPSVKKAKVEPSGQKTGDKKGVPVTTDKNSMEKLSPKSDFGLSHLMTSTFKSPSGLHSIKDESSSAAELESDKIVMENREIETCSGADLCDNSEDETGNSDISTPKPEVIGKKREIEAVTPSVKKAKVEPSGEKTGDKKGVPVTTDKKSMENLSPNEIFGSESELESLKKAHH